MNTMDVYINRVYLDHSLSGHEKLSKVKKFEYGYATADSKRPMVKLNTTDKQIWKFWRYTNPRSDSMRTLDFYMNGGQLTRVSRHLPYSVEEPVHIITRHVLSALPAESGLEVRVGKPYLETFLPNETVELNQPISAFSLVDESPNTTVVLQCPDSVLPKLDAQLSLAALARTVLDNEGKEILFDGGHGVKYLAITNEHNLKFIRENLTHVYDKQILLAGKPEEPSFHDWVGLIKSEYRSRKE